MNGRLVTDVSVGADYDADELCWCVPPSSFNAGPGCGAKLGTNAVAIVDRADGEAWLFVRERCAKRMGFGFTAWTRKRDGDEWVSGEYTIQRCWSPSPKGYAWFVISYGWQGGTFDSLRDAKDACIARWAYNSEELAEDREPLLDDSRFVTINMANATRAREIREYAQAYRIDLDQAIIRLVNSGLSHLR